LEPNGPVEGVAVADKNSDKPMEPRVVAWITGYLLAVTILSGYTIISVWTSQRPTDTLRFRIAVQSLFDFVNPAPYTMTQYFGPER
jgi:hypothetical protein